MQFALAIAILLLAACGGGGSGSPPGTDNGVADTPSPATKTLERIVISPFIDSIAKDGQIDYYTTGIYSDQSSADLTSQVSWSVSDQSLASIDNNGRVSPFKAGQVTVTSSVEGLQAQRSLTITDVTLDSIRISPLNAEIPAGLTQDYSAVGHFSDGSTQDLSSFVIWSSSKTQVADMSGSNATAAAWGVTTISAQYRGLNASAELTVTSAVLQALEVDIDSPKLHAGVSSNITATAQFSDNSSRDVSTVVNWQVDDAQIAQLDQQGLTVAGLKVGDTVIRATLAGFQAQAKIEVIDAALTRIEVSPANSTLAAGLVQPMAATGIFSDQSILDLTSLVTWSSSDDSLASIDNHGDEHGKLTALKKGKVTISAYFQGRSGSSVMTVSDADLLSIEVTPGDSRLANGHRQQFNALGQYSDGSIADVTEQVKWSSDNQNVTLVGDDHPGLFQAKAVGASMVIASLENKQGFTSLEITGATLNSLSISGETAKQALGMSQTLSAFAHYSDGSSREVTGQVSWSSSDEQVAKVGNGSGNIGVVNPIGTGTVDITAKLDSVEAQLSIEITAATLTQIQLTSDTGAFYVNQQREAYALGTYSDGSQQILSDQVQWQSSDDQRVGVSNADGSHGLLSAIAAGQATISATLAGVTSNALSFNVIDNPNYPASLSLSASPNVILNDGADSTTVSATVRPLQDSGAIADGTAVNFIVEENGSTQTIAATTVGGVASIDLTSINTGFIEVTAVVVDANLDASSAIYVTDNFSRVLLIAYAANASLINNDTTYEAGSLFVLYMRNLSNRDFNVAAFIARNGNVDLPDTPVTNPAYLSGGVLEGGEYTSAGYQLDVDTTNNTISLGYILSDSVAAKVFGFSVNF